MEELKEGLAKTNQTTEFWPKFRANVERERDYDMHSICWDAKSFAEL